MEDEHHWLDSGELFLLHNKFLAVAQDLRAKVDVAYGMRPGDTRGRKAPGKKDMAGEDGRETWETGGICQGTLLRRQRESSLKTGQSGERK